MTDTLIREIDEDLKRERFEKLWKQHGQKVLGLAASLVLGTVVYVGYQGQQANAYEKATTELATTVQQLTDANQGELQLKLADLAQQSPINIGTITRLYAVAMTDEVKQRELADAQLAKIADTSAVQPLYRDLASLLRLGLMIDTGNPQELQAKLAPMMADDQPWRYTAREYSGLLLLKTNDTAAAKALFEKIRDDADAPRGSRERAEHLLSQIEG